MACVAVTAAPGVAMAAAKPASGPRLAGCNESSAVRPTRYNPICNDGAYTVISLHWARWARTAVGLGKFYDHGRLYPVELTAWRVSRGDYTRLRYDFPLRVPAGFKRAWTIRYDGHAWHGRVV